MLYFCTYCDQQYLPRGYALYQSLVRYCQPFTLWVLCLDPDTYETLNELALPQVRLLALDALESFDADLAAAKQTRSTVEYYFTCTPSLELYIFDADPSVQQLTYLDSDFYFFGDVGPVFAQIGSASITMTAHRFPTRYQYLEQRYGRYNVGWLTFRNDASARACLERWRAQCISWCYDRAEPNHFADQMYLNEWPERYEGTHVLGMKGVNLAPFNLGNYRVDVVGGQVTIDGEPLICYHFAGLKDVAGAFYYLSVSRFGAKASRVLIDEIYEPYLRALKEARTVLDPARRLRGGAGSRRKAESTTGGRIGGRWGPRRLGGFFRGASSAARAVVSRRVLVFVGNSVVLKSVVCDR